MLDLFENRNLLIFFERLAAQSLCSSFLNNDENPGNCCFAYHVHIAQFIWKTDEAEIAVGTAVDLCEKQHSLEGVMVTRV
jgi:hypothetical protein